jgi:site-specific recombinase XerD
VVVRGPLAPFAEAYRQALEDRGCTPLSAVNLQRQVARLSRWLDAQRIGVEQLDEACIEAFLADQRAGGRGAMLSRPGLSAVLELLRDSGVVSPAVPLAPSPTEELMDAFRRYLLAERGLAPGTVRNYVDGARRFVAARGVTELGIVTAAEVTAAVVAKSTAVSVSATQNYVAGLRAFLRFCYLENVVEADLSEAALPITGRRRSALPRGIAPERPRSPNWTRRSSPRSSTTSRTATTA